MSNRDLTNEEIRQVFLDNGFTIKPGNSDLKLYVYSAARALIQKHKENSMNPPSPFANSAEMVYCKKLIAEGERVKALKHYRAVAGVSLEEAHAALFPEEAAKKTVATAQAQGISAAAELLLAVHDERGMPPEQQTYVPEAWDQAVANLRAAVAATPPAAPAKAVAVPENHQAKLLAEALGECLMAAGIVRKGIDGLSGPQLLMFAEDLKRHLGAPAQEHATQPAGQGPWKQLGYVRAAHYAEDMQAVGEALMKAIEDNYASLQAAGWDGPIESPVEVIVDLLDLLDEAKAAAPIQAQEDAARIRLLTKIEDSGEGLRFGLECLVNNGVNTFRVYDEEHEEYVGRGWLRDPIEAIDAAIAARATTWEDTEDQARCEPGEWPKMPADYDGDGSVAAMARRADREDAAISDCATNTCHEEGPHEKGCYLEQSKTGKQLPKTPTASMIAAMQACEEEGFAAMYEAAVHQFYSEK